MSIPQETCWTLIHAAAQGRTAEREEFTRRYLLAVRAYLAARWRNSPMRREIDDGVQEVFVVCFKEGGALQRVELRQANLRETRNRYEDVLAVMEGAAEKMKPVLGQLHDQVLFLKHNLNARALGSLQSTSEELQLDVSKLIEEMQASIAEADRFIEDMRSGG